MIRARRAVEFCLIALFLLLGNACTARANVYATNIKVNGNLDNASVPLGATAQITYILNEAASGGVTIRILSGTSAVRTITLGAGTPGTFRGTNNVPWDGTGDNSSPVSAGTYSVAITAAAQGYAGWTQTSIDDADGNAVWEGRGIAVDRNTNSPYYGRVFVANSQANDPGGNNWLGYQVGVLKCNSDGSYADEGGTSTGGYAWAGDMFSPWHLEVSVTDRVYVNDFSSNGLVIAWAPTISPSSQSAVLRPDNWVTNVSESLSGPGLFGTGTNLSLWMADTAGGLGILTFSLLPDGRCAPNDTGKTAVAVGGSLTANPVDVALDPSGNIYTIQDLEDLGNPNNRVFRFPPYVPNNPPISTADWAIGANDDTMAGARGIAIDPTGTYLAVAFTGLNISSNGCTQIFYATNGALVTNLDLNVTISGFSDHQDEDCAWDAVGNVYYIDNIFGVWREVSPPGTNFSTTLAVPTITIGGSSSGVQPVITSITENSGLITIAFTAGTNDAASEFTIQSAAIVTGPYVAVTGANIQKVAPGQFSATVPSTGSTQYFRVSRQGGTTPPTVPAFSGVTASGNNVILSFTGSSADTPASFTLLSSPTINGSYSPAANATITQLGSGVFQASVPASGPDQFYRLKR